jgi:CDP-paratose 2-epimerase
MDILVTGAAGLIGFNACKYFQQQGHTVFGMDNLERSDLLGHKVSDARKYYNWNALDELGILCYPWDVSDPESWNNMHVVDAVVHLAGQCGVPTSIANPRRDFEINTVGTFNALEFARAVKAKFVYASTNKVYPLHEGWKLNNVLKRWEWDHLPRHYAGFPETAMDQSGRTPYGASKYAGDVLVQEYGDIFGLRTACFRMSCIYGPNQFGFEEQGWATWFAIATLKGLPITIYGDGMQVRDMLWVEDLVKAYESFLVNDVKSGVWNMGGGPKFSISLNECLDMLEGIIGKRSPVEFKDWRPSDQRVYTTDIGKAKTDLNWRPTVAPREGLEKVVKWAEPLLDVF